MCTRFVLEIIWKHQPCVFSIRKLWNMELLCLMNGHAVLMLSFHSFQKIWICFLYTLQINWEIQLWIHILKNSCFISHYFPYSIDFPISLSFICKYVAQQKEINFPSILNTCLDRERERTVTLILRIWNLNQYEYGWWHSDMIGGIFLHSFNYNRTQTKCC